MKEEYFQALVQGLEETRRRLGGEDVPGFRVHFPPGGDVAAIRERTGVSQTAFARQIGVPVATLGQPGARRPLPRRPRPRAAGAAGQGPADCEADAGRGGLKARTRHGRGGRE